MQHISQRRINFNIRIDTFTELANRGIGIIDRVVVEQMGGQLKGDEWIIPNW